MSRQGQAEISKKELVFFPPERTDVVTVVIIVIEGSAFQIKVKIK